MCRRAYVRSRSWPVALIFLGVAAAPAAAPKGSAPPGTAEKVMEVTDAVLRRHVDPPTRQEMVRLGIRALYESAGVPVPTGLGRRISEIARAEDLAALIDETWPQSAPSRSATPEVLVQALLAGLLRPVPGGAQLLPAKEAKVNEQFQSNLYVGIQIAVGYNADEKRVDVKETFEGGPAQRAGVLPGDLFEKVDGVDVGGMKVVGVVERLRGEEGTEVEIAVRQPKTTSVRTLRMTRGRLMRTTLAGRRKRPSGGYEFRIEGSDPIAYVEVETITGSTPHELRQIARQLESEGIRALVLDLRKNAREPFHPTLLLADALLEGGTIGLARTADRVQTYQADADALFRGWPLAVLIDSSTQGPAEWLAAALQDNHRAVLVGEQTAGVAVVESYVPVLNGAWAIAMATERLERGDGRPIDDPQAWFPSLTANQMNIKGTVTIRRSPLGVKPDQAVSVPRPRPLVVPPGARVLHAVPATAAPAVAAPAVADPRKDPVLTRAVEVLRAALKDRPGPEAGE